MSGIVLPDLRHEVLPNGLRVTVGRRPGVPMAAARLAVRAGSILDPALAQGLAHLVALTARRGAGRRTGRAIDDAVESLGASLGGGAEEDATVLGMSAPVEVLPRLPAESPDVVLRASRDGVILYANAASAPLLQTWGCGVGATIPPRP